MTAEQQRVIDQLEEQLTVKPQLLTLGLRDWLTYEGMVQDMGATFLGLQMKEDSAVPLVYKSHPVVMRANEVKELIKELVKHNAPVPSIQPPTTSGGVKPMTKLERHLEEPQQKKTATLIEELTKPADWWTGDEAVTEPAPEPTASTPTFVPGVGNDIHPPQTA